MFENFEKKYIVSIAAIAVVVAACVVMIALGGHDKEVQIQAPEKDELQIISCQDVVQVSVGEVLGLEKLNLVYLCPNEVSYSFTEKVYDASGIYNEELVVTDNVTGKTDSAMIRVLVKDADGNLNMDQQVTDVPQQDVPQENVQDDVTPEGQQPLPEEQPEPLPPEGQANAMDAYMYANGSINVRNAPGEAGERVGSLSRGQEVHVMGQDAATGWYAIEYGGGIGYVSNEYLAENAP